MYEYYSLAILEAKGKKEMKTRRRCSGSRSLVQLYLFFQARCSIKCHNTISFSLKGGGMGG